MKLEEKQDLELVKQFVGKKILQFLIPKKKTRANFFYLFIETYFKAYEKRVAAKHPNWINESGYYFPLLKNGVKYWNDLPVIVKFLGTFVFLHNLFFIY